MAPIRNSISFLLLALALPLGDRPASAQEPKDADRDFSMWHWDANQLAERIRSLRAQSDAELLSAIASKQTLNKEIIAEGYPAAEMKHGPIALVDDCTPSVFLMPHGTVYEKVMANLQEIKARGGPVIAVVGEGDHEVAQLADDVIEVPAVAEFLQPILSVIPLQLLAYHIAVARGCDVDKPRNLAKSVTVE